MQDLYSRLRDNAYPGRGIVLGRSADNRCAVMAYFIMGRSENSRNRVFVETDDGIRTQAFDPAKMTDPSLIIYHPVRVLNGRTIVTNGDQTDTVRDALAQGGDFAQALATRTFEPDAPNYTPRISGLVEPDGSYALSILKSLMGDPACTVRNTFSYDAPKIGWGHLIHTYQGDGSPLPSFAGEPVLVPLPETDIDAFTRELWDALNADNKVSLFVRFTALDTGVSETRIVNKHA